MFATWRVKRYHDGMHTNANAPIHVANCPDVHCCSPYIRKRDVYFGRAYPPFIFSNRDHGLVRIKKIWEREDERKRGVSPIKTGWQWVRHIDTHMAWRRISDFQKRKGRCSFHVLDLSGVFFSCFHQLDEFMCYATRKFRKRSVQRNGVCSNSSSTLPYIRTGL